MRKSYLAFMASFLFSCNHIVKGDSLSSSDVKYIQSLHLLDEGEEIYKFYSEFKRKNAGNFFTDKRIATYWIDDRDKEKSEISFAFYQDIRSINTVFYAGATYTPYLLITKMDSSQFKVSVNGKKEDVKSFFDDALEHWQQHK